MHIVALPPGPNGASFGLDDWRAANPSATFADLCALELKQGAAGVNDGVSYAIQKTKIEETFCVLRRDYTVYDHVQCQPVQTYAFTHVAASTHWYADADGKSRSAAEQWLKDPDRLTYDKLVLDPGGTPPNCLNLFKGFAVGEAVEGDTLWWDGPQGLLTHVIPDPTVREAVERVLAWPFARPDQWKVFPIIVITGSHGIGKDQIGETICRLIGETHIERITNSHLTGPYDGFLKVCLFLKGEEVGTDRATASKLNKWATSPDHILNPKFEKQIRIPNNTNIYLSSNKPNPIYVESDTERRYLMYESPADPMLKEFANFIAGKLSDSVALSALLFRFKHLTFGDFNRHAPAMKTLAFDRLANEASLSDMDRFVDDLIHSPPLDLKKSDIWQASQIAFFLPDGMKRGTGYVTSLTHSMSALRFRKHIRSLGQVSVNGVKLRLWAVRNGPEWEKRGNAAVAVEYLRANPLTGTNF